MFVMKLSCCYLIFFIPSGILCEYDYDANDMIALRDSITNHTKLGCLWRPAGDAYQCSDSDINIYLYSGYRKERKRKVNPKKKNSLLETRWDSHKHNIIYIHGYGGGDGVFPNYILRDAYIKNGSYNVFVVDWSPLARIPCYTAAVNNLHPVAKCTAQLYRNLRSQGVSAQSVTCVGHSLGAHGCGLIYNYVNFRIHRIIGLDPAGPMIPRSSRLRPGVADQVQVIHTNAGIFGDSTNGGKVNFCMNGGKSQPACESTFCYLAESIDGSTARKAQPCTRQCPHGPRKSHRSGQSVLVGEHTPIRASGSYCVYTNEPPYCSQAGNPNGDPWCCITRRSTKKLKNILDFGTSIKQNIKESSVKKIENIPLIT